jgi:hypothetical protein
MMVSVMISGYGIYIRMESLNFKVEFLKRLNVENIESSGVWYYEYLLSSDLFR